MIVRLATFAMGTRFEIVLAGDDEIALRGPGEAAIAEIEDWDRRLSLFRTDSLVSHINRTACQRPVRLDRETFELLVTTRDVWQASGGALDITMGAIMKRLGFHPSDSSAPDPDTRAEWGMDAVILDEAALSVSFSRPGITLDLGALGKGHAIDAAIRVLREQGVRIALLHGGTSSVGAIGAPDDQPEGWRVALGPVGSGAPVVQLRDASLSVSGQHGRMVERDGERLGHVIDPRTGMPAQGAGLAGVVGPIGRVVEAWSTALLVLNHRPAEMPPDLVSILHTPDGGWRIEGDESARVVVANPS